MTTIVQERSITALQPAVETTTFVARGYFAVYWSWLLVAIVLMGTGGVASWPIGVVGLAIALLSFVLQNRRLKRISISSEQVQWWVGSRKYQAAWKELLEIDSYTLPSGREATEIWFRDRPGFTILSAEFAGYDDLLPLLTEHNQQVSMDTLAEFDHTIHMQA